MKVKLITAATCALLLSSTATLAENTALSTQQDKLSYTIGADMGTNFKAQEININPTIFLQGLQDALSGNKKQMTDEAMKETLQTFQKQMMAKKLSQFKSLAEKNKKVGDKFLAENKAKKGVVTLDSGLQYKVITAGNGAKPSKNDSVTVDYTGQLINGKVFDSSKKTGKPATFKLTQVIPGWTEALQLMKQGATWEVYVPPQLAYGQRGIGGPIGPNETLIFNIHLISIDKATAAKKG